ncbi:MAG: helicase C-terminal domain-containing protein [Candidatus Binatia bacterium]|nr:helicase C-terminal domain-containing protein [Candidatus Binatia bacterium]
MPIEVADAPFPEKLGLPVESSRRGLAAALGAIVVVDLETTGLEPDTAQIIEIGAIRIAPSGATSTFHSLVDPQTPLPDAVCELTGLGGEDLAGESSWAEVGARFKDWARGSTLVAHNVEFERGFLSGTISGTATWLDTLELACILRPELQAHDLATLDRQLLGRIERHRALHDAADALAVMAKLHEEIANGEHDELLDVLAVVEQDWGWSALFGLGGPDDLGPLGRAARRTRPPASRGRKEIERFDPSALRPIDAEDLGTLLSDQERFGREIPGYRVREGQVELTEAIATAFREEKALAIEAGTGIGKTLGYGLVAFLHAALTGERVVVSSANRTLQERVVAEELPAIARVLGVPPLPAVVMKGRANYGSPSRARDIALGRADVGLEELTSSARLFLVSYFARCPNRDLQAFGGWLATRDPGLRTVRERIACSGDCDIRVCRSEPGGACGYLSRVDALADAGVVSINHSLLLSWPGRYGAIDRLIIDEAHELVGEGDRAFAENLQARDIRGALRRVRTHPKRGLVGVLAVRAGRRDILDEIDELIEQIDIWVDDVGARLVAAIGDQESTVPPSSLHPPEGPWVDLSVAVERLVIQVARLGGLIEEVAPSNTDRDEDERSDDPREDAIHREAAALGRFFQNAAGGVLGDLFAQSREDHVYAARGFRKRDSTHEWSLTVTPLDAAELIHARVLEAPKTLVALSATLGVGGDPAPTLKKLGWGCIPRDRRMPSLVLPSPFDFENHAVLGLVRGSTYRDSSFEDDCASAAAAVARMLGGRTMALFTSRRRLFEVARRLREELKDDDISILVQPPSGGAAALVDRFLGNPRSVLLGTRSLWQGVDIPGDALSCVLIDKFPFPQPNDPLLRGRQDRLRAAGEDAFKALSLEPAVVLFKQMFGRLVRSETDRGFVVVLGADPSKRYVEDFIASLPGPPRVLVDDIEVILEEMQQFFDLKAAEAAH